ncbi:hypothetical protein KP509_12G095400 [Ceratopteris richardii]|nr:hypothetical protein KP509_12G095400 [Ceratopteris richardii]KAH7424211.1 hypothetical protein KP509_12G095400 [Ceratopteris richardii]KAH7424214.1 hypothetical protein KP509_12G095400 [Ceratopteris richardii]KAH7424215.1 hypothetical protein KP509_12G095400 [Ceratopteris richardii]KAH7424216.1 hypothetical protein KP509_12G095400 [Ceratopteris richardii]
MGKGSAQGESSLGTCQSQNLAAWLMEANKLEIRPFELPALGPKDVKIRMKAVGICGSDVHYYKHMRLADFIVKEPMVIGHECAGVVEEIGNEVTHLAVGDNVALEPGVSCAHCSHCKEGRYNLCDEMKFFATPPIHGSLANFVVHPASLCFKLPENVSLEEGAMCEPLSVGVHACRRAGAGPHTKVLVMGSGPIGLVTLMAAKAFGSPRVVVVDVDENRLKMAQELGAHEVVCVSTRIEDVEKEVLEIQQKMAADVDITFDCAGLEKTMRTALKATRSGGEVCLVGMGHVEMKVPLTAAAAREVDILGVFRYRNTYQLCIDMISSGRINVKPLITHRFGFSQEDVVKAFNVSAMGGSAIKVMFNI